MKRLGLLAVLAVVPLLLAARPGTEQQLVQQLNGFPLRLLGVDGGAWGVYSTTSYGCAPVKGTMNNLGAGVSANVIVFVPLVPVNVCMRPSVNDPIWDGGCNTIPGDPNYGWPLPANVPQYLTPDSVTTSICILSDAGTYSVPLGWAQ